MSAAGKTKEDAVDISGIGIIDNWDKELVNRSVRDVVRQFGLGSQVEEVLGRLGCKVGPDIVKLVGVRQTLGRISLLAKFVEAVNRKGTRASRKIAASVHKATAAMAPESDIQDLVACYGLGERVAEVLRKVGCKKDVDLVRLDHGTILRVKGCGDQAFANIYLLQKYLMVKHAEKESNNNSQQEIDPGDRPTTQGQ
ncbi:MAG: hypothetical protein ACYTEK_22800 [Planctomycetota bacterium]|jgi:hypothetical protein